MVPLKVRWEFSAPVALSPYPIHLDALLAHVLVNRALVAGGYEDPYAEQERLPLGEEAGVWQASRLLFAPQGEPFLIPYIRSANTVDFARAAAAGIYHSGRNSFTIGTGPYKAFDQRLSVQWMASAEAWCVGERAEVEELLSEITAIGKWNKNGFGRVKRCSVKPAPTGEEERWRDRTLPAGSGLELPDVRYAPAAGRARPPYWDRTRQEMVAVPI